MTTPASETAPVVPVSPEPVLPAAVLPAEPAWEKPLEAPVPAAETVAAPTAAPAAAPDKKPEADAGWKDLTEKWEHEWLDFKGDRLAFRVPSQTVMKAIGYAAGPGSTHGEQLYYTRKLLRNHLSPISFDRVFDRMMDPDDVEYTEDAVDELTQAISQPLIDQLKAEAERLKAEAEAKKAAAKAKK